MHCFLAPAKYAASLVCSCFFISTVHLSPQPPTITPTAFHHPHKYIKRLDRMGCSSEALSLAKMASPTLTCLSPMLWFVTENEMKIGMDRPNTPDAFWRIKWN
jgi:hypothetical protein